MQKYFFLQFYLKNIQKENFCRLGDFLFWRIERAQEGGWILWIKARGCFWYNDKIRDESRSNKNLLRRCPEPNIRWGRVLILAKAVVRVKLLWVVRAYSVTLRGSMVFLFHSLFAFITYYIHHIHVCYCENFAEWINFIRQSCMI